MADKALLVGINQYPGCGLNGCINDVTDMAHFLVSKLGFDQGSIRLLCDGRATTQEIWTRLQWLVDSKPGDRVLFHYSGHGAQVATRDPAHEVDGLDEVICPVDFDWSDPHLIRDKQFHALFAKMPKGVKFGWISDSCHSGDLTRDLPRHTPKHYPVPADIVWRNNVARHKGHTPKKLSRSMDASGVLDVGFISGCRSNQTSADAQINGRFNGALTYYLLHVLNSSWTVPVTNVVQMVNQQLAANGYEQQPQAEGSLVNLPLLG